MAAELQVAVDAGVLFAGVARDGRLTDLLADRLDRPGLTGAVLLGKLLRVDAVAAAGFVALGLDRPGYLPLRDPAQRAALAAGQTVLVQVTAEARDGKGVELTLDIALPGRFLVHTPRTPGIAVSRTLAAEAAAAWRARLGGRGGQQGEGGWIVRSAAAAVPEAAVLAEAEMLAARWRAIAARAAGAVPPVLLEPAPDPARRLILDHPEVSAIRVAVPEQMSALAAWLRQAAPELAAPERLRREPVELLDAVPDLLLPEVTLPSGGSLAIETTRALTAVDVDTGRARDPLVANREAARVLAAQLRLRNIGGLVVIDFISMPRAADRRKVLEELRAALANDPATPHMGRGFSEFGLVELVRRRRGRSLAEVFGDAGRGRAAPAGHGAAPRRS